MASGKRESLSAADWTDAALSALARGGLAAVAVEPLATRLGATKGSFYWHFSGRDALIEATLELWERRATGDVIQEVAAEPDPMSRLRHLIRIVFGSLRDEPGSGAVELALQATATHPLVAPVLTRVTERRLAYLVELFAELGFTRAHARQRGLLAYSAYLGHAQLAHATPDLVPSGRAFDAHLDHVAETLVAGAPAAHAGV